MTDYRNKYTYIYIFMKIYMNSVVKVNAMGQNSPEINTLSRITILAARQQTIGGRYLSDDFLCIKMAISNRFQ